MLKYKLYDSLSIVMGSYLKSDTHKGYERYIVSQSLFSVTHSKPCQCEKLSSLAQVNDTLNISPLLMLSPMPSKLHLILENWFTAPMVLLGFSHQCINSRVPGASLSEVKNVIR